MKKKILITIISAMTLMSLTACGSKKSTEPEAIPVDSIETETEISTTEESITEDSITEESVTEDSITEDSIIEDTEINSADTHKLDAKDAKTTDTNVSTDKESTNKETTSATTSETTSTDNTNITTEDDYETVPDDYVASDEEILSWFGIYDDPSNYVIINTPDEISVYTKDQYERMKMDGLID